MPLAINRYLKIFCITLLVLIVRQPWTFAQLIWMQNGAFRSKEYDFPSLSLAQKNSLLSIKNQDYDSTSEAQLCERVYNAYNVAKVRGSYGTQFFESEKSAYPNAFYGLGWGLGSNDASYVTPALNYLQANDIDFWNFVTTDSVDLFPSFTLKGQVNKYFYFGKLGGLLRPEYMSKFYNALNLWTYNGTNPTDPLLRPHPNFIGSTGCWTPQCRNSWVDTRNTDNLKAMREVSVYLFSEEIGNESIRQLYKSRITSHVAALYHTGYSEWDSENYMCHSFAPFLSLYTFTIDTAVRKVAKAALDWYSVTAALKYYRGLFAGPTKRLNAGNNKVFAAAGSPFPYIYYGETPYLDPSDPEKDLYMALLSHYRPPQAAVEIGKRRCPTKVEQLNTKPPYGTFTATAANNPDFYETMYYGETFHMGSAINSTGVGDVRAFNMAIYNSTRGADAFFMNSSPDGTLQHQKFARDQIGQYRNKVIFLKGMPGGVGNTRMIWMAPKTARFENQGPVWFLEFERTYMAIYPLNLSFESVDTIPGSLYPDELLYKAIPTVASGSFGLAIEVGENGNGISNFNDFKTAIIARFGLDATFLAAGQVKLTGLDNEFLKVEYNASNDFMRVYRNSDLAFAFNSSNYNVYRGITKPEPTINQAIVDGSFTRLLVSANLIDPYKGMATQGWKEGTLKAISNNWVFTCTFAPNGAISYQEEPVNGVNNQGKIVKAYLYVNGNLTDSVDANALAGQTQYTFSIPYLGTGSHELKIKAIDEDRTEGWSPSYFYSTTSIETAKKDKRASFYPNPSYGELYLASGENQTQFRISDVSGKFWVNCSQEPLQTQRITTQNWPAGVYTLQIFEGLNIKTEKLIVLPQ